MPYTRTAASIVVFVTQVCHWRLMGRILQQQEPRSILIFDLLLVTQFPNQKLSERLLYAPFFNSNTKLNHRQLLIVPWLCFITIICEVLIVRIQFARFVHMSLISVL